MSAIDVAAAGYRQDYGRIASVSYSHDAMIDTIIAKPGISQNELAAVFGYTPAWVSRIIGSDAFQARVAERKAELIDPTIVASVGERLNGLVVQSIEVLQKKLDAGASAEVALRALDIGTRALGYGAKQQNVAIQQNFVALVPAKAESAQAWLEGVQGKKVGEVIDASD